MTSLVHHFAGRRSWVALLIILAWAGLSVAAPPTTQTILPGQLLQITVAGHPEFSQAVTVNPDGTVDHPLLAGVPVVGLTALEIRSLLLPSLMRYEREPQVFVVVSSLQKVRVGIFGMVRGAGHYESASPFNLQNLIAMAGNFTDGADPARIQIVHPGQAEGAETIVDLTRHFSSDSVSIAPNLQDGDMVVIPRLTPTTSIRVIGEIVIPGELYLSVDDNIFDVLRRAGGFTSQADLKRVLLITQRSGRYDRIEVNLDRMLLGGELDALPKLFPGDIVIVPTIKAWRDPTWWINWVRDIATLATAIVILWRL